MDHQFCANLWWLRKIYELTQAQLADKMNVTEVTVSNWETGRCMPQALRMARLAKVFGISIDQLMYFDWPQNALNTERK